MLVFRHYIKHCCHIILLLSYHVENQPFWSGIFWKHQQCNICFTVCSHWTHSHTLQKLSEHTEIPTEDYTDCTHNHQIITKHTPVQMCTFFTLPSLPPLNTQTQEKKPNWAGAKTSSERVTKPLSQASVWKGGWEQTGGCKVLCGRQALRSRAGCCGWWLLRWRRPLTWPCFRGSPVWAYRQLNESVLPFSWPLQL